MRGAAQQNLGVYSHRTFGSGRVVDFLEKKPGGLLAHLDKRRLDGGELRINHLGQTGACIPGHGNLLRNLHPELQQRVPRPGGRREGPADPPPNPKPRPLIMSTALIPPSKVGLAAMTLQGS